MKRIATFAIVAASIFTASAQSIYYQDATNVDMARHTLRNEVLRREFVLPVFAGPVGALQPTFTATQYTRTET